MPRGRATRATPQTPPDGAAAPPAEPPAPAADMPVLMRAAVEEASDAVVITDARLDEPGPRIVYVNPAFTRMTGYSADEVVGRSPRRFQGPRTDRSELDRLRAACAAGVPFHGRTHNYRKDGREYLLEWHVTPIRGADGAVTHFVAVQRDVTAAAELEAQLRQSQKMEAVGRLAGGVAHDFNNLLTVIGGNAAFVRDRFEPGTEERADVEQIEEAVRRASMLTQQLLAFSRRQARAPQWLDLNTVVTQVERMLARVIGADVRVSTELAFGGVPVFADPGQLGQVLLNLAVNARDAMPNGGTLLLRTRVLAADRLPAGRAPAAGAAERPAAVGVLTVADTGVGMSAETAERAFEPFFTTKEPGKGTGLGLATVHGIVEQSGGSVWIESAPGAGTQVHVALPLDDPDGTAAAAPAAADAAPAGGTALLVEDDAAVRALARRMLERGGYAVVEARDGAEARERWRERGRAVDVVVTDMVLPDVPGHELLHGLRAERPGLPAVLLSGYAPDLRVESALAEGGATTAFLEKPFSGSTLLDRVARVLAARETAGR